MTQMILFLNWVLLTPEPRPFIRYHSLSHPMSSSYEKQSSRASPRMTREPGTEQRSCLHPHPHDHLHPHHCRVPCEVGTRRGVGRAFATGTGVEAFLGPPWRLTSGSLSVGLGPAAGLSVLLPHLELPSISLHPIFLTHSQFLRLLPL